MKMLSPSGTALMPASAFVCGFNTRAETLKENARGGGGARKARSARLGDAKTRGVSPIDAREAARARDTHHEGHQLALQPAKG